MVAPSRHEKLEVARDELLERGCTPEEVDRAIAKKSLLHFVPWKTPSYAQPRHLRRLIERIERALDGEAMRLVVSTPPRHGKTETLLHAIAWALWRRPDLQHAYCSYGADITRSKSRIALNLTKSLGVRLASENVTEWLTPERGGLRARSVTEGLTGHAISGLGIIDDPVKGRLQAESSRMRDRLKDWCESEFLTRLEPGSSAICNMARWHPDDLAGWLIKEKGWEELCLPALGPGDVPLWPERWPLDALLVRKGEVGDFAWASLYQGRPRPRGGAVFGDAWVYDALPQRFRVALGIDMAYSKKSSSDWSVIVVMAYSEGYYYILDVVRTQAQAPAFAELVKLVAARYPTARQRWYGSGIEVEGIASFMRPKLPKLEALPAIGDKFIRAQPCAAMWNSGRILLPEDAPWLDAFLGEVTTFTGVNDSNDDQVDALVAAFDILAQEPAQLPPGTGGGQRRY